MIVNDNRRSGAVEKIIEAYLDNGIYDDRVKWILADYFFDEDNTQLQERVDEIDREIR